MASPSKARTISLRRWSRKARSASTFRVRQKRLQRMTPSARSLSDASAGKTSLATTSASPKTSKMSIRRSGQSDFSITRCNRILILTAIQSLSSTVLASMLNLLAILSRDLEPEWVGLIHQNHTLMLIWKVKIFLNLEDRNLKTI